MQVAPWVEKLDEKFGHLAIPHVTRYLLLLQAVTYILNTWSPGFTDELVLQSRALHFGEIWRVVTFMCVPVVKSPIWFFMYLWFTWTVGDKLEAEWGAAKINLYYLVGIVALTLVALFFASDPIAPVRSDLLMITLVLPFGTVFAYEKITLYFILPIEARFAAMFTGVFLLLAFLLGFLDRFVVLASVLPYLLFFAPTFFSDWKLQQETEARRRRVGRK